MIEARHLTKRHGKTVAADDVSFVVQPGRALDTRVKLRGQDSRLVAGSWLRAQGLASTGGALH
jgi:hypothetical protein